MFRIVKRRNGESVSIPVDEDGYVPFHELIAHNDERSPKARRMDERRVSKRVHSPLITPEDTASWWVNPGRSDIYGVDARKVEKPAPRRETGPRGVYVKPRPPEAPELIPIPGGRFWYDKKWYEALGDANFVARDPWKTYTYMVDAKLGNDFCRVYFDFPKRIFLHELGPRYNSDYNWGRNVAEFEWLYPERWADRPKGYALNYSVRRNGRRG